MFSKDRQLEAQSRENLLHTGLCLKKMMRYWGMLQYLLHSIKERYRLFAEAASSGSTLNNVDKLVPMLQYGDWFDRCPSGMPSVRRKEGLVTRDGRDSSVGMKDDGGVAERKADLQSVEEFFSSLNFPTVSGIQSTSAASRGQIRDTSRGVNSVPSLGKVSMSESSQAEPAKTGPAQANNDNINLTSSAAFPPIQTTPLLPQSHDQNQRNTSNVHFGDPASKSATAEDLTRLDRKFVYGQALAGVGWDQLDQAAMDNPAQNMNPSYDTDSYVPQSIFPDINQSEPLQTQHQPQSQADAASWFLPFNLNSNRFDINHVNFDPNGHSGLGG